MLFLSAFVSIGKPDDEDAKPRRLHLPGSASELHWSPDGTRLVVALAPTPLIDDYYMKRKIHVVDVDTGGIISRIDKPGEIGRIAWSPDGTHLAVIAAADLHDPGLGRLTVVPAAGGPQLQAAQHPAYHDASPPKGTQWKAYVQGRPSDTEGTGSHSRSYDTLQIQDAIESATQ